MKNKVQEYSENINNGHHPIINSMTYLPVLDICLNLFFVLIKD